jgi:hypothetical protein
MLIGWKGTTSGYSKLGQQRMPNIMYSLPIVGSRILSKKRCIHTEFVFSSGLLEVCQLLGDVT